MLSVWIATGFVGSEEQEKQRTSVVNSYSFSPIEAPGKMEEI